MSRLPSPSIPLVVLSLLLVASFTPSLALQFTPSEVKLLQQSFLKRFGMKTVPSLSSPSLPVPAYVWELYRSMGDEESPPDAVRHFYPQWMDEIDGGVLLSYNLSVHNQNASSERVFRANLKLKLQWLGSKGKLRIYEYDMSAHQIRRLLDTVSVEPREGDFWLDLDISTAFERPRETNSVELLVELDNGGSLSQDPATSQSLSALHHLKAQSAALVLFIEEDSGGARRKRATGGGRRSRKGHHRVAPHDTNLCQMQELYVDFKELNWQDWILAPVGYEAGHCTGGCPNPLPSHLNATNHAIMQSLIHSMNPGGVPPPSCVPTATESLSILYMDIENRISIKNYPDMKVTACGCR